MVDETSFSVWCCFLIKDYQLCFFKEIDTKLVNLSYFVNSSFLKFVVLPASDCLSSNHDFATRLSSLFSLLCNVD